jgi:diguanylate cyclase (GGDEF)-like protein
MDNAWARQARGLLSNGYIIAIFCAALGATLAWRGSDVIAAIASLDAEHEGWHIDHVAMAVVGWAVTWTGLIAMSLKREVRLRLDAERISSSLARHDPLTGLPNRRVLIEALSEIATVASVDQMASLLLIDLDRFKPVNDLHGHAAGDLLLCEVAGRLIALVDGHGMAARLGGDEFALLLPTVANREQLLKFGDRVVSRLSEPYYIAQHRLEISASVGIALAPTDGHDGPSLLHAADVALYQAKRAGRGTCRFFEHAMDVALQEQAAIKADLHEAIVGKQIVPYYQPTVDLATQQVNGFEVLARWQHPTRGVLTPDKFIQAAEDMNLLSELTISLFEQVCADAEHLPERHRISLNLSPLQLHDKALFEKMRVLYTEAGLDAGRFEIEITEGALIENIVNARATVDSLRQAGFSVALDDFGTGYSSLYHLREIHFDRVKIDRSFIRDIGTDERAASYADAMIRLGRSLHLNVTAEGVEDEAALNRLMQMGCDVGQGYLFAKPMPMRAVAAALDRLSHVN